MSVQESDEARCGDSAVWDMATKRPRMRCAIVCIAVISIMGFTARPDNVHLIFSFCIVLML